MNSDCPFKADTQIGRIFKILSDLKWHCSECELPGSQPAKALQIIRQEGYELEKVGSNWEKRMYCNRCKRNTPHRRLVSTERNTYIVSRYGMTQRLKTRIIQHYDGKDAILGYRPTGRSIEIDHRVPQVRWSKSEEEYDDDMPESAIEKHFILLTREHNLLKSRNCERCVSSGQRQPFIGVNYFYLGSGNYDRNIGCVGCGWHSPEEWKRNLNDLVNNKRS